MEKLALLAATLLALVALCNGDGVKVEPWGTGGALLYTLSTESSSVSITDWGATITSFKLRDARTGKDIDVVMGFDHLEPYMDGTSPYFGAIVGRVANRIKHSRFTLNGTTYFTGGNDHGNTLHGLRLSITSCIHSSDCNPNRAGGFIGYNDLFWRSRDVTKDPASPSVEFLHYSYNTEQGFPGDVDITVTYTLSGNTELRVEMHAVTRNKMTPLNLAHHSYWNLAGHDSGSALNHTAQISASHYTPVDGYLIPTGNIAPVKNTPFDFSQPETIGSRIQQVPGGYDHNFALDKNLRDKSGLHHAVTLEDPVSTRKLELWTNQPGLQFYTGNMLKRIEGKNGAVYAQYGAVCLETQGFPNAVNQPNFPSVILKPHEVYTHIMVHKFTQSS